ncbi:response regulator [Falsiroseomonas sp. HC035]|uniref:response regulator n=1 Tax=Falsiroseomonas sp. HC035 TaxID=3390999 RepID=UPI003D321BED
MTQVISRSSTVASSGVRVTEDRRPLLAIAAYLRDCGWRVLEAGSAEEAMTVLRAGDVAVDVIFSDVQMPGDMDGFDLARWVPTNRPEVRVLLTSGAPPAIVAKAGDLCEERSGDEAGLLTKPYREREVVRRIEAMLARAARSV